MKFKWTNMKEKEFDDIKITVAHDTLLAYLDLNNQFDMHTYASDYHLVAVISQDGKPITFYTHKLTKIQTRYMLLGK